jgi:hypothetical protein
MNEIKMQFNIRRTTHDKSSRAIARAPPLVLIKNQFSSIFSSSELAVPQISASHQQARSN